MKILRDLLNRSLQGPAAAVAIMSNSSATLP